jgi:amidase
MAGQEAVISVSGPMARDLEDIKLFTKTIIDSEPWWVDPKCVAIPWRVIEPPKKLKIGVLWNDGVVMPSPPVRRALSVTVERLRTAGHEVVDWGVEGHAQAADLIASDSFSS